MGCGSRPDAVMVAVEVVTSTSILTSESDGVRVKDRSQGGPLVAGAQLRANKRLQTAYTGTNEYYRLQKRDMIVIC